MECFLFCHLFSCREQHTKNVKAFWEGNQEDDVTIRLFLVGELQNNEQPEVSPPFRQLPFWVCGLAMAGDEGYSLVSMESDPFNDVKEEVTEQVWCQFLCLCLCFIFFVFFVFFPHVPLPQLTKARVLHKRWKEILVNPVCKKDDAEFPSLHRELKQLSDAIGWGLADLAETIWIVESNRSNFLLGEKELTSRKRFVEDAKSEIEEMKKGFQDPAARALMKKFDKAGLFSGSVDPQSHLDQKIEMDNENFIQQQLSHTRELEEEQEVHAKSILRSVNTIEQVSFLSFPIFFFIC